MPRHFKCVLIEDEQPAIEILKTYLINYPEFDLRASFGNAFQAQDYLREHAIDLLFLDLNLPGINGLDFLKSLKNPPLVIITSAYDEYANEAFDLEVFDYLLKPYSLSRFNRSIARIKNQFSASETKLTATAYIHLKSGTQQHKVKIDEIDYIESQREFLLFFREGKEVIKSRMTMQEAMNLLKDQGFIQIHRSFLVNLNRVKITRSNEIHIKSKVLPIGRSYKTAVIEAWQSL